MQTVFTLAIGVYALGALLAVGILAGSIPFSIPTLLQLFHLGLHCILVSTNQTTNEYFKETFQTDNPFSLGLFCNCFFLWCPPYYPQFVFLSLLIF